MATTKKKEKTLTVGDKELTLKEQRKDAVIDLAEAIKKRAQGATYQDIANIYGVSKTAAYTALEPYKEHLDELAQYSKNKDVFADIASHKVYKAILNKSQDDIASEKLSSLGAFLKTQHEIHRLETGQSTSNVSLKVVDLSKYTGENEN